MEVQFQCDQKDEPPAYTNVTNLMLTCSTVSAKFKNGLILPIPHILLKIHHSAQGTTEGPTLLP